MSDATPGPRAGRTAFNHVGLCVTDMARARRFYEDLLGFQYRRELQPSDASTASLLRIEPPVNLTAVYLVRDGLVLELLHFDRPDNAPARERSFTEPGLTHLSISVEDTEAVCRRVPEYGGEVLRDTQMGPVIVVRDPDGQAVELLPITYRDSIGPETSNYFDVVHRQRAHRQFSAEPLADHDLRRVLDAGRFAPSAENAQPWTFVVVTDADDRAVIGDLTQRAWLDGGREYEVGKLAQPLFDDVDRGATGGVAAAPVHVVVAGDTNANSLPSSLFPSIQNMLLAATALGLGSALTTLATRYGDELGQLLGLPAHITPVAVIPLGHPARPLGLPRRRPLREVAHHGRYGVPFDDPA